MPRLRIAVLVSGGGTNLQSLIDATKEGTLQSTLVCVISNKEKAYGLERARKSGIPAFFIDPKQEGYNQKLLAILQQHEIDLIVLAGYLKIVDSSLVDAYPNRIINIHPSLLPKFGGKGFYGKHVHEAVLLAGEKRTGATVHFVDKDIDTGKMILQESLEVFPEDTAESLQKRVLEQIEHKILVKAILQMEEDDK